MTQQCKWLPRADSVSCTLVSNVQRSADDNFIGSTFNTHLCHSQAASDPRPPVPSAARRAHRRLLGTGALGRHAAPGPPRVRLSVTSPFSRLGGTHTQSLSSEEEGTFAGTRGARCTWPSACAPRGAPDQRLRPSLEGGGGQLEARRGHSPGRRGSGALWAWPAPRRGERGGARRPRLGIGAGLSGQWGCLFGLRTGTRGEVKSPASPQSSCPRTRPRGRAEAESCLRWGVLASLAGGLGKPPTCCPGAGFRAPAGCSRGRPWAGLRGSTRRPLVPGGPGRRARRAGERRGRGHRAAGRAGSGTRQRLFRAGRDEPARPAGCPWAVPELCREPRGTGRPPVRCPDRGLACVAWRAAVGEGTSYQTPQGSLTSRKCENNKQLGRKGIGQASTTNRVQITEDEPLLYVRRKTMSQTTHTKLNFRGRRVASARLRGGQGKASQPRSDLFYHIRR